MREYVLRHFSDRGMPLVFQDELKPGATPVLTVENYKKWYSLFLVTHEGVRKLTYGEFPITWHNHVPNPAQARELAEKNGWEFCSESYEMMVGRFIMEVLDIPHESIGANAALEEGRYSNTDYVHPCAEMEREYFGRALKLAAK